jgi:ketosteroid isomerase-like protein
MSQENVELVRRGIDAFRRAAWEESVSWMSPDVEWHDAPDLPGARRYVGREGVLAQWKGMAEALDDFTVEIEQIFDAGDQVVVFRDGQVTKLVGYDDRAQALEAAGLRE